MKEPVTFTEMEYLQYLQAVRTSWPIFPANWSNRKRKALAARKHREDKELWEEFRRMKV